MPMKDEFGRTGISHKHNRVTFPTFSNIHATYKKLPDGYTVGMISEIENLGLKAVLCKNGSTALPKWVLTESNSLWIEDTNLSAAAAKGQNKVEVVTASAITASALPKDSLNGGYLWVTGGEGLVEDGAGNKTGFRKLLIAGNDAGNNTANQSITIYLAGNLRANLNTTTDVIVEQNQYMHAIIGTDGNPTRKVLGETVLPVPTNEYYWAVFYGDMPANAGTAARGARIIKAASGAVQASTAGKLLTHEILGRVKHQGTQDIITLDIRGIDLQNSQAVDVPAA